MKKKLIFIILAIIILTIIFIIIRSLINMNKPKTSIEDFSSVKELVEFDGHKYISMENSKEDGYKKDIYISFSKPAINDDGTTNQSLYEIVISHVAGMLKGENFRIIDSEKNIVVRIQFNENNEVSLYTINNDSKYWEHITTEYQIDNLKSYEVSNLNITSPLLIDIINNNWVYNKINLGTKDSTIENYEEYFDEGYKVRKIGSKIYNIIFSKNYTNQLIDGITTNNTISEVEEILGQPTFEDEVNYIIGYKCEYFYIFFTGDEISVYPPDQYNEEDSKQFGNIVAELNKTGDINTFLNKLTDIYPDYADYYTYNNNKYIRITYPLLGFEVIMGAAQNNGITIYNNFMGYITDSVTIENLKENKEMPANVYTKLDENLVLKFESERESIDKLLRNPYDYAYYLETDDYAITKEENTYLFYSRDKSKLDSELEINDLTNMIIYNQTTFIYGRKNDGIYMYDAEKLNITKLIDGEGDFNIIKFENGILYYDNKTFSI